MFRSCARRAGGRALSGWIAQLCLVITSACSGSTDDASLESDASSDVAAVVDSIAVDSARTLDVAVDAVGDAPDAAARDGGVRCSTVAHIGDSLTAYTLGPLTSAYANVGVTAQLDAFGGRAILQKLPDDPKTGKQAALDFVKAGFRGCFVVALGTNDTANVAAGASYSRATAIDEMMKAIDPTAQVPVMWVNTFTTKTTGYWSNDNMKLWNQALVQALGRWPNLKLFDWAAIAAAGTAPFSDGIHHTTAGYSVRNEAIAQALVAFHPAK